MGLCVCVYLCLCVYVSLSVCLSEAQEHLFSASSSPLESHLRVLKLYYKVASSHLPAPQIAPCTKVLLPSRQFSSSSSPDTPRTQVVLPSRQFSSSSSRILRVLKLYYQVIVLPSHQFSSSHSPDTPRTKGVLPSRQFSSSSSPATPRTTVVLQSR